MRVHLREAVLSELVASLKIHTFVHGSVTALALVTVWVVDLGAGAVHRLAWHLVVRHERIGLTRGHDSLQHATTLGAVDVVVASNGSDLVSAARVVSEGSESLRVSLRTLDILRLQVPDSTHCCWQSTWNIAINFTVGLVERGCGDFHEVSVCDLVTHNVLGHEWVIRTPGLPVLVGHISVVDVAVASGASVGASTVLRALNVLNVHDIAHWSARWWLGARASDIIDRHLVTHELVCIWLHVVEALQLVLGVERIFGRISSC